MRINKTVNNLKRVWHQLDNASGELHNAMENLALMVDIDDDTQRQAEGIDISRIDSLKNVIEQMIEEKGGKLFE
jgi:ABC-type transporter Mla subunit MlaD